MSAALIVTPVMVMGVDFGTAALIFAIEIVVVIAGRYFIGADDDVYVVTGTLGNVRVITRHSGDANKFCGDSGKIEKWKLERVL